MTFTANKNVIEFTARSDEANRGSAANEAASSALLFDLNGRLQTEKFQWLAMIVESSSDAIVGNSLDGVIVSWNEAAERLFGYPADLVMGQPLSTLFPGAESDEVQSLMERCSRGEHIDAYETECIRQDGLPIGISLALSPIKNKAGAIAGVAAVARDITQRKRAEDRLHHLAFHDSLTGLPNRFLLRERVSQALLLARRHDHKVALLFIDLNRFKEINDTLGHQTGDRLLQVAAGRLRGTLREGDTVARLGGDEFVVCLSGLTTRKDATLIAAKIQEALREPFRIGSAEINISGSIGMSVYPADGQDIETLLQVADTAMYRAKKKAREDVSAADAETCNPNLMKPPNATVASGY